MHGHADSREIVARKNVANAPWPQREPQRHADTCPLVMDAGAGSLLRRCPHKNVLIRSFLLSRGREQKIAEPAVFDATASVNTVCSSWAKRLFSVQAVRPQPAGLVRARPRKSIFEIPAASKRSVDGRQLGRNSGGHSVGP
jgi:hypothetical protein